MIHLRMEVEQFNDLSKPIEYIPSFAEIAEFHMPG